VREPVWGIADGETVDEMSIMSLMGEEVNRASTMAESVVESNGESHGESAVEETKNEEAKIEDPQSTESAAEEA